MNIRTEIKDIKATTGGWYNKRFDAWFHFLFSAGVGAAEISARRLPVFMRRGCWIIDGHTYDWFWSKAEMRRVRNWLVRNNCHSLKHIKGLLAIWRRDEQAFRKEYHWFETHDWRTLSDTDLADRYDRLYQSYAWCNSIPYLADCFLTSGEEDAVARELRIFLESKVSPTELPEIIQALTQPVYDSFINRSHKSQLRLALSIERQPRLRRALKRPGLATVLRALEHYPKIRLAIDQHVRQFHWIRNNYYEAKYLGVNSVLAEVKKLLNKQISVKKELDKEESLHRTNRLTKRRLIKRHLIPRQLQNLIHLSEIITRWQDDRKSAVYKVNAIMFPVVREAVKRTGVPWRELVMTTREEFYSALKEKKFQLSVWCQRRKRAIAVHTKRGSFVLTGQQSQLLKYTDFFKHLGDDKTLTGVTACGGSAKGKVRIVDDTKNLKLMRRGDILVANNTTPDYVPAMKLAGAIVTEQGGITGHAAIVSRELGVPCVVGVEQITKILHTGQVVEVDATKGRISILKQ